MLHPCDSSPNVKRNDNILRVDRETNRGGGVMISMPQTIEVVQNSGSCCNGIEQINVTFKYNNTPFYWF